jgi:hypothetical protein
MSITGKKVTLDGTGHGSTTVNPCYFVGARGGGVSAVTDTDGMSLGTAFLTRANAVAVEGEVDVVGSAGQDVFLFFDY